MTRPCATAVIMLDSTTRLGMQHAQKTCCALGMLHCKLLIDWQGDCIARLGQYRCVPVGLGFYPIALDMVVVADGVN